VWETCYQGRTGFKPGPVNRWALYVVCVAKMFILSVHISTCPYESIFILSLTMPLNLKFLTGIFRTGKTWKNFLNCKHDWNKFYKNKQNSSVWNNKTHKSCSSVIFLSALVDHFHFMCFNIWRGNSKYLLTLTEADNNVVVCCGPVVARTLLDGEESVGLTLSFKVYSWLWEEICLNIS